MVAAAHSPPALGWAWLSGAIGVSALVALDVAVLPQLLAGEPGAAGEIAAAVDDRGGDDAVVARRGQRDTVVRVLDSAPAPILSVVASREDATGEERTTERAVAEPREDDPAALADGTPGGEADPAPIEDAEAREPGAVDEIAEAVVVGGGDEPSAPTPVEPVAAGAVAVADTAPEPEAPPPEDEPAAVVAPAPSPAAPRHVALRFAMDAHALEPHHEAALAPLADAMRARSSCALTIDCHADRFGEERFNEILTQRRCRSVVAYFEASGAGGGRVKTRAHGERDTPGRDGELDPSARVARVVLVCGAETPAGVHGDPEE